MRAGQDELAEVAERVVVDRVGDASGPGVDRHERAARPAAPRVRAALLVEREAPLDEAPRRASHRQRDRLEVREELVRDPRAARDLRDVVALARIPAVERRHRARPAAVPMPRGSGDPIRGGERRVGEDRLGVVGPIPVVIVDEQLRGDAVRLERRQHEVAKDDRLRRGVHRRARIVAWDEERFVLQRHVVDRNPRRLVRLHVLHEVVRERTVHRRQHRAADHRPGRLHPPRRAPRRGHDLELRVALLRGEDERDDVGLVVRDREAHEIAIGLARRQVVVRVVRSCEVGGAHRISQEADADSRAGSRKERVERRRPFRCGRDAVEQVGRRVGHRRAEPLDLLIDPAVVDVDHVSARRGRRERHGRLRFQPRRLLVGRQPDVHGLRARDPRHERDDENERHRDADRPAPSAHHTHLSRVSVQGR